jgi:hypothetical protein
VTSVLLLPPPNPASRSSLFRSVANSHAKKQNVWNDRAWNGCMSFENQIIACIKKMSFVCDVVWGIFRLFPELDAEYSRSWNTYMIFVVNLKVSICYWKYVLNLGIAGPWLLSCLQILLLSMSLRSVQPSDISSEKLHWELRQEDVRERGGTAPHVHILKLRTSRSCFVSLISFTLRPRTEWSGGRVGLQQVWGRLRWAAGCSLLLSTFNR